MTADGLMGRIGLSAVPESYKTEIDCRRCVCSEGSPTSTSHIDAELPCFTATAETKAHPFTPECM